MDSAMTTKKVNREYAYSKGIASLATLVPRKTTMDSAMTVYGCQEPKNLLMMTMAITPDRFPSRL